MLVRILIKDAAAAERFVDITSRIEGRIEIFPQQVSEDNKTICQNKVYSGKSIVGILSATANGNIHNLYCISDKDIKKEIAEFIVS